MNIVHKSGLVTAGEEKLKITQKKGKGDAMATKERQKHITELEWTRAPDLTQAPASSYLTGGSYTSPPPYAAWLQAQELKKLNIKPVERKKTPSNPPTVRVPASNYLTGEASMPDTPYAAGPQAGIVKTPERKPVVKEKAEPVPEVQAPTWTELMGRSAEELKRQHTTTVSQRNALQEQIGAVAREHAGPNSTYGASAGQYKPREENPFSSSAAASG